MSETYTETENPSPAAGRTEAPAAETASEHQPTGHPVPEPVQVPPPSPAASVLSAPAKPQSSAGQLRRGKRPPRYIALMNQKGGVGKTTTTANVAAALARADQQVLVIDLDPQAHLTLHLGLEPAELQFTIYDLLTDEDVSAFEVVQQPTKNLSILPAEVNLAGAESELAADMMTGRAQRILKEKCASLLQGHGFDFVLIDCPPSLGLLTINALTLANEVIVPMQAHFLALQGLSKLFETVQLVRQGFNSQLSVAGVVLCMHEGQTILGKEVQNDLESFLTQARGTELPWAHAVVYEPPIRRNIKLAESPSFGQSIFDYAPDCHGATDYRKLAQSIIAQQIPVK